ncbi:MAG: formylglycine-generating enzyme family protein [Cyanothece sp. SIO2G6]|nr:formylglycine-generating enzyme family protein [Cyanothece sp. SIO2G6]
MGIAGFATSCSLLEGFDGSSLPVTDRLSLPITSPQQEREQQQLCEADGDFVWIPQGPFLYGSDRPQRDYAYQISAAAVASTPDAINQAEQRLRRQRWFDREPQQQEKTLPGFCLSRNLVTNADYQAFVQATNHPVPFISEDDYQAQGFLVHAYETVAFYLWEGDRYPQGRDHHPVVLVSYEDAIAYAQWQGAQTGGTYRLPTAEEWEKAARGTDGAYFPWGNDWQDQGTNWARSHQFETVPDEALVNDGPGTSAIATFPLSRSEYGVEDMAGNVFEYTSTLRRHPQGWRSVMKGCSWDDLPGFCRGAYEHTRPVVSRHILFGFRLVKE